MASATVARPRASWTTGRCWHRAAREPLPPVEAGRDHLIALLAAVRAAEGCQTAWDDRRETSVKAVYRALWRLGHAERSGCFATTPDQLVAMFTAVMGWRDHGGRDQNRSAHARSVRRWLDDLQAMGLIEWGGVRDNLGRWWRTEIRLLRPPAPDAKALAAARRRMRTFPRRERRRRARNPARRRDLGQVLGRSTAPPPPVCRRRARTRARAIQATRAAQRAACHDELNVSSNPFGAPPPVGDINDLTTLDQLTFTDKHGAVIDRTGESLANNALHDQIAGLQPSESSADTTPTGSTPASKDEKGDRSWQDDVEARITARLEAIERREDPLYFIADTKRRSWETLATWPEGRPIPDRILAEAFEHATGVGSAKIPRDRAHRAALERALARYRRWVEHRPTGWPESAPAALALAMRDVAGETCRDGDTPQAVLYAIGRLNITAKQMAAAAKRADQTTELTARAARLRRRDQAQAAAPIGFRVTHRRSPRWGGSTETSRRSAIEQAIRGELPGLEALHGFLVRSSDLLLPHDNHDAERRDAHHSALTYIRVQHHRDAAEPLRDE